MSVRRFGLAYTIFETLNTRGLDLTQADLIKNQIISMGQSQTDRDLVISNWNNMVTSLPDEDTAATEFIRAFHASSVADVKAGELFAVITTHLGQAPVLTFSDDLKNEASNYTRVVEANVGHTNTNDLLSEINNVFAVKMCNILLLSGAQVFGLAPRRFSQAGENYTRFLLPLYDSWVRRHTSQNGTNHGGCSPHPEIPTSATASPSTLTTEKS